MNQGTRIINEVIRYISERQAIERAYYNGVCAAVAQIGGWERDDKGKHLVKLNC